MNSSDPRLLNCPACGAALDTLGTAPVTRCAYCGSAISMPESAGRKPQLDPRLVPLKLYWDAAAGDNFTTATAQGEQDALAAGYGFIRLEGYVFAGQEPGSVPFKLFWNGSDNFTTATAQGEQDALAAGYRFIRIEGYVFPQPAPGTVPLNLYWNGRDNLLTATAQGIRDALTAGYRFIRTEGYIYPTE